MGGWIRRQRADTNNGTLLALSFSQGRGKEDINTVGAKRLSRAQGLSLLTKEQTRLTASVERMEDTSPSGGESLT